MGEKREEVRGEAEDGGGRKRQGGREGGGGRKGGLQEGGEGCIFHMIYII